MTIATTPRGCGRCRGAEVLEIAPGTLARHRCNACGRWYLEHRLVTDPETARRWCSGCLLKEARKLAAEVRRLRKRLGKFELEG